mmetsp:Transcript_2161/g.3263  ORF Transcript_2161/g.3263 Transcript_2161/m.3263 type:complete len:105 (-) Transcript_2161:63-377(-)
MFKWYTAEVITTLNSQNSLRPQIALLVSNIGREAAVIPKATPFPSMFLRVGRGEETDGNVDDDDAAQRRSDSPLLEDNDVRSTVTWVRRRNKATTAEHVVQPPL